MEMLTIDNTALIFGYDSVQAQGKFSLIAMKGEPGPPWYFNEC